MVKDYTIGIYIRLSMADEDTGNGSKAESDSIGNQRMLINRYLDNHPTLSKYPRLEFADDGYTGTNFHRPQFAAMMEKVRHGEINLICVKDFSRFSRDYIETGNYLECTFPFMGVRFISINDGYDSDDYKGTTGGLEVVMRSIIYAAYSKDLSVKTMCFTRKSATSSSLTRKPQKSCAGFSTKPLKAGTPPRLPLV